MLIILFGSVSVYIYYLKEKNSELESIKRGFCPKCHQNSIELTDQRAGGCSGPKLLSFTCIECKYTNSFAVENDGGCGSGSCG
jgi:RNase P subunit RPR2